MVLASLYLISGKIKQFDLFFLAIVTSLNFLFLSFVRFSICFPGVVVVVVVVLILFDLRRCTFIRDVSPLSGLGVAHVSPKLSSIISVWKSFIEQEFFQTQQNFISWFISDES